MTTPKLDQLELITRLDELAQQLRNWVNLDHPWKPLCHSQNLMKQLLNRAEDLRLRIEQPLVVATFGGTGTGKSSLVNALVGKDVSQTGKQRPTTRKPVMLVHPTLEISSLSFPVDDFEIQELDVPILRDIIIVDCPDPDTDETEESGSNLARLHRLLPSCDVLIYTSTQQKYRSARVNTELSQAASGCRLLFVQTHAALDEDIRHDWGTQIKSDYHVPEMFYIDSLKALQEQRQGATLSGDFGRLYETIQTQLAASQRHRIRRANLLDLLQGGLDRSVKNLQEHLPAMRDLQSALDAQHQKVAERLTRNLTTELLSSRSLWERRLLNSVAESWGVSPFSLVLRLYNSLGNLAASLSFYRARNSAQMAIIGAIQGMRWMKSRQSEQDADQQLQRLSLMGLDDNLLKESQIVISGYAQAAQLDSEVISNELLQQLQTDAIKVEEQFMADVSREIDEIIERVSQNNSGTGSRIVYESLWGVYLLFVFGRVGKNFFYDSLFGDQELLRIDFYIPAAIFLVLWSGVLLMALTFKIRRGLKQEISQLADKMANRKLAGTLYPGLESFCHSSERHLRELEQLQQQTAELRTSVNDQSDLGAILSQ